MARVANISTPQYSNKKSSGTSNIRATDARNFAEGARRFDSTMGAQKDSTQSAERVAFAQVGAQNNATAASKEIGMKNAGTDSYRSETERKQVDYSAQLQRQANNTSAAQTYWAGSNQKMAGKTDKYRAETERDLGREGLRVQDRSSQRSTNAQIKMAGLENQRRLDELNLQRESLLANTTQQEKARKSGLLSNILGGIR